MLSRVRSTHLVGLEAKGLELDLAVLNIHRVAPEVHVARHVEIYPEICPPIVPIIVSKTYLIYKVMALKLVFKE